MSTLICIERIHSDKTESTVWFWSTCDDHTFLKELHYRYIDTAKCIEPQFKEWIRMGSSGVSFKEGITRIKEPERLPSGRCAIYTFGLLLP